MFDFFFDFLQFFQGICRGLSHMEVNDEKYSIKTKLWGSYFYILVIFNK